MTDKDKEIEDLKTEVTGLKIRVKRLEEYVMALPDPSDYVYLDEANRQKMTGEKDELFDEVVKEVRAHDKASASLIQRRFGIGFNRAARLIEQLEEEGIVEKGYGAKPRKVIKEEK